MVHHRDAAIKKIQSKSGIINAQEFFGARDSQPLTTCLEEVGRSQVFLLFLSPRYGSVDHESGKSFVEREYEKACELGILKLAYVMDENHEYPIKHVSKGLNADHLEVFKQRVMNDLTISKFTSPDDLASKVFEDLKRELPKNGFQIGVEDEKEQKDSVIDALRRFCLLPKMNNGRKVQITSTLGELQRASSSQCNALSLKRGEAVVCDIYPEDTAIAQLLSDSKIALFAEGKAAASLLDVSLDKTVAIEAQCVYGLIKIRTPYYDLEYESGLFDSMLTRSAGRQRVVTGYEETKEDLLGLYLKEIRLA
jgi:hypothetical protein